MAKVRSMRFEDDTLYLIDQRALPVVYEEFPCKTYEEVVFAIKDMVVRGAPAIGVAAGYGAYIASIQLTEDKDYFVKLENALEELNQARPTAVNLMWAISQAKDILNQESKGNKKSVSLKMKELADKLYEEDAKINETMATFGNEVIPQNATILTHCNTGALATVAYGTALGVIRKAHETNKNIFVYADETRPRLQGGRLTAWELVQEKIPAKLIADNAAATLIRDKKIDVILVGADRIAANGDTANKIGTFMLSVIAKQYNVPFYIVAPTSTIDLDIVDGNGIDIEERSAKEITHIRGIQVAPLEIEVYNPAFDVTPNENITGIITEKGVLKPPFNEALKKAKSRG